MAEMIDADADESPIDPDAEELVSFWTSQLSQYEKAYRPWEERAALIVRRYRDERSINTTVARYNVLWSNIQTLQPAIYSNPPKPIVERRFQDTDPIGRIASMTLERAIEVQVEIGYLHPAMRQSVLDYLLVGRGVIWERYEPTYGDPEPSADGQESLPPPVTYEKTCTDYVYWRDFRHAPERVWQDVWWVAKRDWLTKQEGVKRFGDKFKNVPLKKQTANDSTFSDSQKEPVEKACVWEIWDRTKRQVIFIADSYTAEPLEVTDDPLKLEQFWPCPKPLYATLTNDTLIPVPDYLEYQDQARELDNLTGRIGALTKAVKAAGFYDASNTALKRLLNEGVDNTMFPVESWASFSEKGGAGGVVSMMPLKDIIAALIELYNSREKVKQDLYEITGIADIVRGQSSGTAKTATEQRIKGQFANLRLSDRQNEVARFARDAIAISGEIVAEHFDPQTIAQMTNIMPVILNEIDMPDIPKPQVPQGAPPRAEQMLMAQYQQQVQMAEQQRQMMAQDQFMQAMALLRDEKLRTFRVDIETDSTIEPDATEAKQSATELVTATLQGLTAAAPLIQGAPELAAPITALLGYAFRTFRVGRSVEASFDEAMEQIKTRLKNPQPAPPDPKVQAEQIKAQAEGQKAQASAQTEALKQMGQQKQIEGQMQLNAQQMDMEERRLQIDERKMALQERQMTVKAALAEQALQAKLLTADNNNG